MVPFSVIAIFLFRTYLVFGEAITLEVCLNHPAYSVHVWDCPYGLVWYWIAQSIPHPTVPTWTTLVALIDIPMMFLAYRYHWKIGLVYQLASMIDYEAPYNMPILWLCLLGLISWKLLWIPVIAKLPVGGPISEWHFIVSWSLQQPYAYVFYVPLFTLWLTILFKDKLTSDMGSGDKMGGLNKDDDRHKPLMEKLEPTRSYNRNAGFHSEAKAWSKTGREFAEMIMDFIRSFLP